ncbi:amidase [Umezawaea tangerina]|uniref:Amidase n=1 Tax=Umezawaea tangerina TaxID=84725 RepID=A0A2T0TGC5_9PSEU|nr:amidase [Umezawaea tangerina]PRY44737.1 amidase [Umezawaea tangerina]
MEIWELSARAVAHGVRTGEFTAVQAAESVLGRVAEVDPAVNALVELHEDGALAAAKVADDRVRAGEPVGPLHGVPVTFKVNTNVAGLPTTEGVGAYTDRVATESDPQVTSWLRAGAIPLGRTNCPPFATRWATESEFYGATANPWDPGVTAGGSSGGAAAAVATGMSALAQGNDIGGSIRYPAVCCGVVGIRPTKGVVPGWAGSVTHDPAMAAQAFVAQGPLARTVDDLRLGLEAMRSPDPRDATAVPPGTRLPPLTGPVRVALVTGVGGAGLAGTSTPESVRVAEQACRWLTDAGYRVEEVAVPQLGEAARLWWELALTEFDIGFTDEVRRVGEPGIGRFFELMYEVYRQEFGSVDLARFVAGYARRGMLRREVSTLMADYPLIVTPMSGEPPFPVGADVLSADRTAELMAHQWPSMAVPVLGLPALGVPVVRGAGAPMGVQVIGRAFDEHAVFLAGEVIEARSGIRTPVTPG